MGDLHELEPGHVRQEHCNVSLSCRIFLVSSTRHGDLLYEASAVLWVAVVADQKTRETARKGSTKGRLL